MRIDRKCKDCPTTPIVLSVRSSLRSNFEYNCNKYFNIILILSLLAAISFRLLIFFANSLDPDQYRQNFDPDLDPKQFDTMIVFLKNILFFFY